MITLTTGKPGAGKTLYTLGVVEDLRISTGRPVYYDGIKSLKLDWIEAKGIVERDGADMPTIDWSKLPENSILVLDEAWKLFPTRKQGSKVPGYVEFLATHRHHGLDIFLITQDRQQLDTFVRKLVARHLHVSRQFGMERVTVYQWERVADPTSEKDQKEALKVRWSYDKKRFDWYESAFAHTGRRDFPVRILSYTGAGVVAVVLLGWFAWGRLSHDSKALAAKSGGKSVGKELPVLVSSSNPWRADLRAARVAGKPETAPMYDGLFVHVVAAPQVAGCMEIVEGSAIRCTCTSEQGTKLSVPVGECSDYVRDGLPFNPHAVVQSAKVANIEYLNSRDRGSSSGAATMVAGGPSTVRAESKGDVP